MQSAATFQPRKVAVITGGASGIGFAMTEYFASQDYNVVVLDVNREGSDVIAGLPKNQGTLTFTRSDVSDWDDLASAFRNIYESHGRIDVVMANAGIGEKGISAMSVCDESEPVKPKLQVLDVNLIGVIYTVKLATYYMQKNEITNLSRGTILCTSSSAGVYAFPTSPLYAASKFGVIGLVRSMAPVLERSSIQINAFAPGVLLTNIAPDQALFDGMAITPFATIIDGIKKFLGDTSLTGEVAEIHGNEVTLRAPNEFVDDDTRQNMARFWDLGWA